MAELTISMDKVKATAGTIRTLNNQLDNYLKNIEQQINSLSGPWQSDASTALQREFKGTSMKYFSQYKKIIDDYAKFLDDVVTNYTNLDKKLESDADAIS